MESKHGGISNLFQMGPKTIWNWKASFKVFQSSTLTSTSKAGHDIEKVYLKKNIIKVNIESTGLFSLSPTPAKQRESKTRAWPLSLREDFYSESLEGKVMPFVMTLMSDYVTIINPPKAKAFTPFFLNTSCSEFQMTLIFVVRRFCGLQYLLQEDWSKHLLWLLSHYSQNVYDHLFSANRGHRWTAVSNPRIYFLPTSQANTT